MGFGGNIAQVDPNRTGLIKAMRSLNCTSDTTLVSVSMTEQASAVAAAFLALTLNVGNPDTNAGRYFHQMLYLQQRFQWQSQIAPRTLLRHITQDTAGTEPICLSVREPQGGEGREGDWQLDFSGFPKNLGNAGHPFLA
jgi:hypothetical protein